MLRGDAHPRVTGCKAKHGAFPTLEEARIFLRDEYGVTEPKEVFKEGAGETAPLLGSQAFYAVANGANPGIYPCY
jgi:viroplasmin and RNaseH domain-containing protein